MNPPIRTFIIPDAFLNIADSTDTNKLSFNINTALSSVSFPIVSSGVVNPFCMLQYEVRLRAGTNELPYFMEYEALSPAKRFFRVNPSDHTSAKVYKWTAWVAPSFNGLMVFGNLALCVNFGVVWIKDQLSSVCSVT